MPPPELPTTPLGHSWAQSGLWPKREGTVSSILDKKAGLKSWNNCPITLHVVLTLIGVLIRPSEQVPKRFGGSRAFPWEPWGNPCSHCRRSTSEAKQAACGFHRQSRRALRHYPTALLGQASRCTLPAEKAHVVGSQILWGGQGTRMLSCPENDVGAWHPHLGTPDVQPLIIPWPASHLTQRNFGLIC